MMNAKDILEIDAQLKAEAGGESFSSDAAGLLSLYEGRSRSLIYNFIATLQLGDKSNPKPPSPNLCRRMVEQVAVLYRSPPTRRLRRAGELVADSAPEAVAVAAAYKAARITTAMQRVDRLRTLLRQSVVVLCENQGLKRVTVRVHPPQNVYRAPSLVSADVMDQDEAVAFLLRAGKYEVWNRTEAGWHVQIQDEEGNAAEPPERQPYAESNGLAPFEGAPFLAVYDEDPLGRPWLPIDQSLLDTLLNVGANYCDLVYLVAMETHTLKVATGLNPYQAPQKTGPNQVLTLPAGSDLKLLAHSPQIQDATSVNREVLAGLALASGLAPNAFAPDRTEQTGASLRAADRLIDARRLAQVPMAEEGESALYAKLAALHNANAKAWGKPPLPTDVELVATFAEPVVPSDPEQEQRVGFNDLQAGLASPIAYVQKRLGVDREKAIEHLLTVREDRALVGWTPNAQPPGAVMAGTGPNAALGPGSATKDPTATNLDASSNNEQASSVGALVAGQ